MGTNNLPGPRWMSRTVFFFLRQFPHMHMLIISYENILGRSHFWSPTLSRHAYVFSSIFFSHKTLRFLSPTWVNWWTLSELFSSVLKLCWSTFCSILRNHYLFSLISIINIYYKKYLFHTQYHHTMHFSIPLFFCVFFQFLCFIHYVDHNS